MKKAKLLGAIALMFALVLGAASCAQDSTPSETESSGTKPSGTDIKDVIDNPDVDFSGIWRLTDVYNYECMTNPDGEVIDERLMTIKEVTKMTREYDYFNIFGIEFDDNLYTKFSNDFLKTLAEYFEEMEKRFKEEIEKQQAEVDADFDWYFDCCLKVNEDYNEIYIYVYRSLYKPPLGYDANIKLTFTKQQ